MKQNNGLIKGVIVAAMMMIGMMVTGSSVMASELNFSVTPVIPDNQVDKNKTYFDIQGKIGEEQVLEADLANYTKKDVTIEIDLNRATTNVNGIVEYGKGKFIKDSSLVHNIGDLVKVNEPSITLKPNETKRVSLTVAALPADIKGVLSGGITFKEKESADKEESSTGLAIKNEYAFLVGLLIHGKPAEADIPSEVKLNDVRPGQQNARNMILANLQNTQPKYESKMTINAKVTKKGDQAVLYENEKKDLQMAPNSNFDYGIALDGKRMAAGDYTLTMKVTSKTGEWEFVREFNISAEKAKQYNEKDVTIPVDYTWWYVGGAVFLLILLQVSYVVVKKSLAKKKAKGLNKKGVKQTTSKKKRKSSK